MASINIEGRQQKIVYEGNEILCTCGRLGHTTSCHIQKAPANQINPTLPKSKMEWQTVTFAKKKKKYQPTTEQPESSCSPSKEDKFMETMTGKSPIPPPSSPTPIDGVHGGSGKLGQTRLTGTSRGKAKAGEPSGSPSSTFLGTSPSPLHKIRWSPLKPRGKERQHLSPPHQ